MSRYGQRQNYRIRVEHQSKQIKGLKADIGSKDDDISEVKGKLGVYEHVVKKHKEKKKS